MRQSQLQACKRFSGSAHIARAYQYDVLSHVTPRTRGPTKKEAVRYDQVRNPPRCHRAVWGPDRLYPCRMQQLERWGQGVQDRRSAAYGARRPRRREQGLREGPQEVRPQVQDRPAERPERPVRLPNHRDQTRERRRRPDPGHRDAGRPGGRRRHVRYSHRRHGHHGLCRIRPGKEQQEARHQRHRHIGPHARGRAVRPPGEAAAQRKDRRRAVLHRRVQLRRAGEDGPEGRQEARAEGRALLRLELERDPAGRGVHGRQGRRLLRADGQHHRRGHVDRLDGREREQASGYLRREGHGRQRRPRHVRATRPARWPSRS